MLLAENSASAIALILLTITHIIPVWYLGVQKPNYARNSAGARDQGLAATDSVTSDVVMFFLWVKATTRYTYVFHFSRKQAHTETKLKTRATIGVFRHDKAHTFFLCV